MRNSISSAARTALMAVIFTLFTLMALMGSSVSAWATAPGTGWAVFPRTFPTNLLPGGSGRITISILNMGAMPSKGSVTVTDTLPAGLVATGAGALVPFGARVLNPEEEEERFGGRRWICSGTKVVTCTSNPEFLPIVPDQPEGAPEPAERIGITVEVENGAQEHSSNAVTVAGGGAVSPTSTEDPVTVSSAQPGFGFSGFDEWLSNADGTPDTQAGSHPYKVAFALGFNELADGKLAGGEARNLDADLPAGFFGDPGVTPRCTRMQLDANECPVQSQIGVEGAALESEEGGGGTSGYRVLPVFNMVPPPGVPFEFAFSIVGLHSFFDAGVRSGGGYGIVEHIDNIPRVLLHENILTLWGVPPEASHDAERHTGASGCQQGGCPSEILPRPFLTLPTSCAGPQAFTIHGLASWTNANAGAEATSFTHNNEGAPTGFTGCEHLSVEPSLSAVPDTSFADTPAGLTVDVKVPQETLTLPYGLVAATIKNTTVTLPQGVAINPGQAAGLVACQPEEANVQREGPASCPTASKVGTVKIKTPLLENALESELEGNVYVLQSNPPNLQLLLAASGDGIFLKLVGNVHLDEATGQLTTTFSETPELPFTDLKLAFSGGAQAALATPTRCGVYTTTSDFTPWTTPFGADVLSSSSFPITNGTNGASCPGSPLPFGPSLIAGSTTDQAGGFTDFSMLLQAPDDQQRIERLRFKVPSGLLGMISRVPLCGESQAAQGTCSSASQIGHTTVASGPGPYPLVVPQPGQPPAAIYLTGPYEGAPFGLSIVVPVVVGPFTLQTQIVRARIDVDPLTSQITVTTDPLPQVIDGVPTDLRTVDAVIDRPGFMFNPTNCAPMSFSGTAWGTPPPGQAGPGSSAGISSHFQMGSCQALKFKPDFKVSTSGKASRKNGASLDVKLLYPTGPLGANQASSQSNIAQVKVDLPKQLPSRLTTLQKACPSARFEANPATCPADSRVGRATAITPVLPVALTGPAYFVSYGGAKFPELVFVLQGYGVTVYVHAETFISKAGITSSTLRHVPDVPISSFELNLPEGPYSALAANGNLCAQKLKMPTAFTAQNGAVIHQSTHIAVTGCTKHKAKAKKARKTGKRAKGQPHRKK